MKLSRFFVRSRRLLLLVAALPLLQVGACQTTVNRTLAGVANQLPAIVFNTFFETIVTTVLQALGIDFGGAFGNGSSDSGGFGDSGLGGGS